MRCSKIQFFRSEAAAFRQEFYYILPSNRKQVATKIISTYLQSKSPVRIQMSKNAESSGGKHALRAVKQALESTFDLDIFDDLAYIALHDLKELFDGSFIAADDCFQENIPDEDPLVLALQQERRKNKERPPSFKDSAFFQALQNDLSKCYY